MSTDLHARLIAAVTARRELAQAATPGPWAIWRDLDHQGFYTVGDEAGVIPEGAVETDGECNPTAHVYVEPDAAFIAANSPAQILRDTEAHLKILERHKPCTDGHRDAIMDHWSAEPYWRHAPRATCHEHASPTDWPCPDALDLAGIYPEVTE